MENFKCSECNETFNILQRVKSSPDVCDCCSFWNKHREAAMNNDFNMNISLTDQEVQDILIALHDSIVREEDLMKQEQNKPFEKESARYVQRI